MNWDIDVRTETRTPEPPNRTCEFPFDRDGLSVTVSRYAPLLNIRKEIKQNEYKSGAKEAKR